MRASDLPLTLHAYGNGYRPTAEGTVGKRPFAFRLMNRRWVFLVGKADVEPFWWHASEAEVVFETSGPAQPCYHTESLPYFLDGLRQYLESLDVREDLRDTLITTARQQADACFARRS